MGDKLAICTVIGFPNGYSTTAAKCFETADAVANGADEIDMVINIGELKAGNDAYVLDEIKQIKKACGKHILKVRYSARSLYLYAGAHVGFHKSDVLSGGAAG